MGMQDPNGRPGADTENGRIAVGPVDAHNDTFPKVLCDPNDNSHLDRLMPIAQGDAAGLLAAHKHYGNSWKKRGGVSAFMMLARKWDRLEKFLEENGYDIFKALDADKRGEGLIDDIRDLRRYLLLIEAEAAARGIECAQATHRDNIVETAKAAEQRYGGMDQAMAEGQKLRKFSELREQLKAKIHETVVNVDGHRVKKGGPEDDMTWHPDHEGPDNRMNA